MKLFKSFEELSAYQAIRADQLLIERIGKENCEWILRNHHLYNLNELSHKTGLARLNVVRLLRLCGISTEIHWSAGYTTARQQGEVAGRARENGYIVDGLTIRRQPPTSLWWRPNIYLEHQAVGSGYDVLDEYGQTLVYKDIVRPSVLSTEKKDNITVTPISKPLPKIVEATEIVKLKEKKSGREVIAEVIRTEEGLRMLTPEQQTRHRRSNRTGHIYYEIYNKGHGIRAKRCVGEMMVRGRRYRFRSTNSTNVQLWIEDMIKQFSEV